MEQSCVKIFDSGGTPGLPFEALGCKLRNDELASYFDDDEWKDWDFFGLTIDSRVDVHLKPGPELDSIRKLWCLTNVVVPRDTSGVFSIPFCRI